MGRVSRDDVRAKGEMYEMGVYWELSERRPEALSEFQPSQGREQPEAAGSI